MQYWKPNQVSATIIDEEEEGVFREATFRTEVF